MDARNEPSQDVGGVSTESILSKSSCHGKNRRRISRTSLLDKVCPSLLIWTSQSQSETVENSCLVDYLVVKISLTLYAFIRESEVNIS